MPHEILVIVQGGVVQAVCDIPPDVVVKVMDYDVEGCDERELERDPDGQLYAEAVWTSGDSCGATVV